MLFVLLFEKSVIRISHIRYFFPKVEMTHYEIIRKIVTNQRDEIIGKVATSQRDD